MKVLTDPREIAAAILNIVNAGTHYNQGFYFSYEVLENTPTATGASIRQTFEKNVCGSTACVAGNAVVLTLPDDCTYDWRYNMVSKADGRLENVTAYAARVLGLDYYDAAWLFQAERSVDEVKEALTLLAAGESISDLVVDDDDWWPEDDDDFS